MKLITLSQGKYAIVDDEDFEIVSKFKWSLAHRKGNDYAYRTVIGANGSRSIQLMHTFLMGRLGVDHKNGNGLDNRRENLRGCTPSQNAGNMRKSRKSTSSMFKGVYWSKHKGKWHSSIKVNYIKMHLGYFDNEVQAALAYDKAARIVFGVFAAINFPTDGERGALVYG